MGLIDSYRRTLELTEIEERLQALKNSQASHAFVAKYHSNTYATGIETFATASGTTMTHAESLDLIAGVGANNYNTSNGTWLVHPTCAATLGAQAKDSGSGQFVYQNGMIAGRRVIETTHVAAGTCHFSLFENVMIGTFGGVDIVVDPYTKGSTGITNIYAYQLCDIGVLRPNAFQKVTLTP